MTPENNAIPNEEEIRIQLRRVLMSKPFTANQNSARFLAFVVDRAVKRLPIRQSIIGSELFPEKYARNDISDVRVTANKLRQILPEYFKGEGQNDPILIALPTPPRPGEPKLPEGVAYKPLFSYNQRNAAVAEYLKGCFHFWKANPEDDLSAIRHFNNAIERAPRYASPYIAKAELLLRWAMYGGWQYSIGGGPLSIRQCLAKSARLLRMAIKRDPNAWRAHAAMGAIHTCNYQWTEARKCFEIALEKNRNDTRYQSWYYAACLMATGNTDEAVGIVRARSKRSPGDPTALTIYGCLLYAARKDFTHASLLLNHAGNIDEHDWTSALILAQVYASVGDSGTALAVIGAPGAPNPRFRTHRALDPLVSGLQILCLARAGKKKEALARLRWAEKGNAPPLLLALAYMGLGETEKAIAALSRAQAERYPLMAWLHLWPVFDPLREHPKFRRLLMRMNLPAQN